MAGAMPADPLPLPPDPLTERDLLILKKLAIEDGDEHALSECEKALAGDAAASKRLRDDLLEDREVEIDERRYEIYEANTDPDVAFDAAIDIIERLGLE